MDKAAHAAAAANGEDPFSNSAATAAAAAGGGDDDDYYDRTAPSAGHKGAKSKAEVKASRFGVRKPVKGTSNTTFAITTVADAEAGDVGRTAVSMMQGSHREVRNELYQW